MRIRSLLAVFVVVLAGFVPSGARTLAVGAPYQSPSAMHSCLPAVAELCASDAVAEASTGRMDVEATVRGALGGRAVALGSAHAESTLAGSIRVSDVSRALSVAAVLHIDELQTQVVSKAGDDELLPSKSAHINVEMQATHSACERCNTGERRLIAGTDIGEQDLHAGDDLVLSETMEEYDDPIPAGDVTITVTLRADARTPNLGVGRGEVSVIARTHLTMVEVAPRNLPAAPLRTLSPDWSDVYANGSCDHDARWCTASAHADPSGALDADLMVRSADGLAESVEASLAGELRAHENVDHPVEQITYDFVFHIVSAHSVSGPDGNGRAYLASESNVSTTHSWSRQHDVVAAGDVLGPAERGDEVVHVPVSIYAPAGQTITPGSVDLRFTLLGFASLYGTGTFEVTTSAVLERIDVYES
jgi:hypothetical protein